VLTTVSVHTFAFPESLRAYIMFASRTPECIHLYTKIETPWSHELSGPVLTSTYLPLPFLFLTSSFHFRPTSSIPTLHISSLINTLALLNSPTPVSGYVVNEDGYSFTHNNIKDLLRCQTEYILHVKIYLTNAFRGRIENVGIRPNLNFSYGASIRLTF
jgi:hypothetical protein